MAVGAIGTLALGTAALLDLGPFATRDPAGLEVADSLEDCREAGLDRGQRCDSGADIETINLWRSDDATLALELQLTEAPDLGSGLEWTAEFYVDAANDYTEGGVICRLSNVEEGALPGPEAVSYALDPNTVVPRETIEAGACSGRLDGRSARFFIDMSGQPVEAEFRLIGLVRLEYPADPDHLGSDDDFLVRTSLAELRR